MATNQSIPEVPPGLKDVLTFRQRAILVAACGTQVKTLDRRIRAESNEGIKALLREDMTELEALISNLTK